MEDRAFLRRVARDVAQIVDQTPTAEFGEPGGIGADGLPATRIDRLAEQRILDAVEEGPLDLNVCSEEAGVIDHGADRTLIVDPIDGTTNAVNGIPFYCVSLAIAGDGLADLHAGLVRNLPTGDVFEAERGEGAFRNGDPVSTRAFQEGKAVRSPVQAPENLPPLRVELEEAPYVRGLGAAALEMCLVAQGAMDVFLHLTGGLRVMDIAASTLIVEEAGGTVITPSGDAPSLPFDPTVRTSLVAVGDAQVLSSREVPA